GNGKHCGRTLGLRVARRLGLGPGSLYRRGHHRWCIGRRRLWPLRLLPLRLLPLPLRTVSLLRPWLPPRLERLCLGPRLLLSGLRDSRRKSSPRFPGERLNFAALRLFAPTFRQIVAV